MASQKDVARQFALGHAAETIPTAHNFHATPAPDGTPFDAVILSYGWAVVAGRRPDGSVVIFDGWRGYSTATNTQIGKMTNEIEEMSVDVEKSDERPKFGGNSLNWRVNKDGTDLADIDVG